MPKTNQMDWEQVLHEAGEALAQSRLLQRLADTLTRAQKRLDEAYGIASAELAAKVKDLATRFVLLPMEKKRKVAEQLGIRPDFVSAMDEKDLGRKVLDISKSNLDRLETVIATIEAEVKHETGRSMS